jgi:hypothetical protein
MSDHPGDARALVHHADDGHLLARVTQHAGQNGDSYGKCLALAARPCTLVRDSEDQAPRLAVSEETSWEPV